MNLVPGFGGRGGFVRNPARHTGNEPDQPPSGRPEKAPETGKTIPGPFGRPLSLEGLPSPDTRRWVIRRKAEVLAAINGGLLSMAEACQRYHLSPEELELWQQAIDRAGVPGLRVTRIQLYRELSGSAREQGDAK